MPIYEYSCEHCRMIYQFFARSIGSAAKTPVCPRCGATDLKRLLSSFAPITGSRKSGKSGGGAEMPEMSPMAGEGSGGEGGAGGPMDDPFANMSPEQQAGAEREMFKLMSDAESIDENDPRQMGHMMERMMKIVGQGDTPEIREAIRRLKAGEDPEKVEADLGDVLGLGGPGEGEGAGGPGGGYGHDSNLYDM